MSLEDRLKKELLKRKQENNLRELSYQPGLIDFYSNDYLGLARNESLYRLIAKKHSEIPFNGATGSRLLSGNTSYYEEVEEKLATIFKAEAALIFNSGYTANLAVLSTLPKKGDTVIYDELAHACIKDGVRLNLANRFSFRHNDIADLEKKLKIASGDIFIVIESVYSMDGDESPLADICNLAEHYSAKIIIDEAHTTGIYGVNGAGLSVNKNLQNKIFARIYTFGKAMGIHGAAVAGSKALKEYLVNFARPFIYTTALPPHSLAAIDQSFDFLKNNGSLQQTVMEKVRLFKRYFSEKISRFKRTKSDHPIQSILIGGNSETRKAASFLQERKFDVRPILSPTVKIGQERLRICLHTYNTDNDIRQLIDTLALIRI